MSDTILHLSVCDNQTPTPIPIPSPPTDRCRSLMRRPSNPWAKQYTTYPRGVMAARQCVKWRRGTHTLVRPCSPVPQTDHSIWCQTMSFFFFFLLCHLSPRSSFPPLSLSLLTSLTCHDQTGALRVQRLTWTPGGCRSITRPFFHLAFFFLSLHPSITPPSPYILFSINKSRHSSPAPDIVSVSFNFM